MNTDVVGQVRFMALPSAAPMLGVPTVYRHRRTPAVSPAKLSIRVYDVAAMAQQNFRTPNAVGPIKDAAAQRICSLAGIDTARQKVINLSQLRDGLQLSIRDLEQQRRKDQIVTKALGVARFTKATCDAFLGLAAAMSKAALGEKVGKQADLVNNVYSTVTPMAEAAGTRIAGGQVDWLKTSTAIAYEGVSVITDNDAADILTKTSAIKVEVVRSALNQDAKSAVTAGATYVADLNTVAFEAINFKKTAAAVEIMKEAATYQSAIGEAFDEMIEGNLESQQRYLALKTTIVNQGKRLSKSIDEMERFIMNCEIELRQAPPEGVRRYGVS